MLYIKYIFTGNSNWTQSTLVKECRKAKCVWWQHPENNCPDQLAGVTANQKKCTAKDSCSGTCTSTNCDCVEWYHQVNNTYVSIFYRTFGYNLQSFIIGIHSNFSSTRLL